jgi:hypothetical protein
MTEQNRETDQGFLSCAMEYAYNMYLYWNINLPVGQSVCGSTIVNVRESLTKNCQAHLFFCAESCCSRLHKEWV